MSGESKFYLASSSASHDELCTTIANTRNFVKSLPFIYRTLPYKPFLDFRSHR